MTQKTKTPPCLTIRDPDLNSELASICNALGIPWNKTALATLVLREAVRLHKSGERKLPPAAPAAA